MKAVSDGITKLPLPRILVYSAAAINAWLLIKTIPISSGAIAVLYHELSQSTHRPGAHGGIPVFILLIEPWFWAFVMLIFPPIVLLAVVTFFAIGLVKVGLRVSSPSITLVTIAFLLSGICLLVYAMISPPIDLVCRSAICHELIASVIGVTIAVTYYAVEIYLAALATLVAFRSPHLRAML